MPTNHDDVDGDDLCVYVCLFAGVTMREKRGGAMSKMQKLRKRLSLSFGRLCKYQYLIFIAPIFSSL